MPGRRSERRPAVVRDLSQNGRDEESDPSDAIMFATITSAAAALIGVAALAALDAHAFAGTIKFKADMSGGGEAPRTAARERRQNGLGDHEGHCVARREMATRET